MKTKPFSDMPLWPDSASIPLALPDDATRTEHFAPDRDAIERLTDVTRPTLSFFPATGSAPRPAVLVCPGGGYGILAWNHEGTDIVAWLVANGISAFLLKYRCPGRRDAALADAARALRIIKANAEAWHLDPARIGTIGFSAGAHLSVAVANLPSPETPYPPADEFDAIDPRPAFQFVIYPAYLDSADTETGLAPELAVSAATPPAFIFQAEDDKSLVGSSFAYAQALQRAGVRMELHIVPSGGHGYGLLHHGNPSDRWPLLAMEWFQREIMATPAW